MKNSGNRDRGIRRVSARTGAELAEEWDRVAGERDVLISQGRDLSYQYVLLPALRELSAPWLSPGKRILDVGCGTGKFAAELAEHYPACELVAIDSSVRSIEIATSKRDVYENLRFDRLSVEEFSALPGNEGAFDLVIANMLFQNVASLSGALEACVRVMRQSGALVFAVSHPCFWPKYWNYDKERWFRYDQEQWIEAPFRTSLMPQIEATTTHTHRPLCAYIAAFADSGLLVERLDEPYPDEGIEGEYPIAWEFPRFLLGRCLKRSVITSTA